MKKSHISITGYAGAQPTETSEKGIDQPGRSVASDSDVESQKITLQKGIASDVLLVDYPKMCEQNKQNDIEDVTKVSDQRNPEDMADNTERVRQDFRNVDFANVDVEVFKKVTELEGKGTSEVLLCEVQNDSELQNEEKEVLDLEDLKNNHKEDLVGQISSQEHSNKKATQNSSSSEEANKSGLLNYDNKLSVPTNQTEISDTDESCTAKTQNVQDESDGTEVAEIHQSDSQSQTVFKNSKHMWHVEHTTRIHSNQRTINSEVYLVELISDEVIKSPSRDIDDILAQNPVSDDDDKGDHDSTPNKTSKSSNDDQSTDQSNRQFMQEQIESDDFTYNTYDEEEDLKKSGTYSDETIDVDKNTDVLSVTVKQSIHDMTHLVDTPKTDIETSLNLSEQLLQLVKDTPSVPVATTDLEDSLDTGDVPSVKPISLDDLEDFKYVVNLKDNLTDKVEVNLKVTQTDKIHVKDTGNPSDSIRQLDQKESSKEHIPQAVNKNNIKNPAHNVKPAKMTESVHANDTESTELTTEALVEKNETAQCKKSKNEAPIESDSYNLEITKAELVEELLGLEEAEEKMEDTEEKPDDDNDDLIRYKEDLVIGQDILTPREEHSAPEREEDFDLTLHKDYMSPLRDKIDRVKESLTSHNKYLVKDKQTLEISDHPNEIALDLDMLNVKSIFGPEPLESGPTTLEEVENSRYLIQPEDKKIMEQIADNITYAKAKTDSEKNRKTDLIESKQNKRYSLNETSPEGYILIAEDSVSDNNNKSLEPPTFDDKLDILSGELKFDQNEHDLKKESYETLKEAKTSRKESDRSIDNSLSEAESLTHQKYNINMICSQGYILENSTPFNPENHDLNELKNDVIKNKIISSKSDKPEKKKSEKEFLEPSLLQRRTYDVLPKKEPKDSQFVANYAEVNTSFITEEQRHVPSIIPPLKIDDVIPKLDPEPSLDKPLEPQPSELVTNQEVAKLNDSQDFKQIPEETVVEPNLSLDDVLIFNDKTDEEPCLTTETHIEPTISQERYNNLRKLSEILKAGLKNTQSINSYEKPGQSGAKTPDGEEEISTDYLICGNQLKLPKMLEYHPSKENICNSEDAFKEELKHLANDPHFKYLDALNSDAKTQDDDTPRNPDLNKDSNDQEGNPLLKPKSKASLLILDQNYTSDSVLYQDSQICVKKPDQEDSSVSQNAIRSGIIDFEDYTEGGKVKESGPVIKDEEKGGEKSKVRVLNSEEPKSEIAEQSNVQLADLIEKSASIHLDKPKIKKNADDPQSANSEHPGKVRVEFKEQNREESSSEVLVPPIDLQGTSKEKVDDPAIKTSNSEIRNLSNQLLRPIQSGIGQGLASNQDENRSTYSIYMQPNDTGAQSQIRREIPGEFKPAQVPQNTSQTKIPIKSIKKSSSDDVEQKVDNVIESLSIPEITRTTKKEDISKLKDIQDSANEPTKPAGFNNQTLKIREATTATTQPEKGTDNKGADLNTKPSETKVKKKVSITGVKEAAGKTRSETKIVPALDKEGNKVTAPVGQIEAKPALKSPYHSPKSTELDNPLLAPPVSTEQEKSIIAPKMPKPAAELKLSETAKPRKHVKAGNSSVENQNTASANEAKYKTLKDRVLRTTPKRASSLVSDNKNRNKNRDPQRNQSVVNPSWSPQPSGAPMAYGYEYDDYESNPRPAGARQVGSPKKKGKKGSAGARGSPRGARGGSARGGSARGGAGAKRGKAGGGMGAGKAAAMGAAGGAAAGLAAGALGGYLAGKGSGGDDSSQPQPTGEPESEEPTQPEQEEPRRESGYDADNDEDASYDDAGYDDGGGFDDDVGGFDDDGGDFDDFGGGFDDD